MHKFKFPKASRGTVYRKLLTSGEPIIVELRQRDVIFEHEGENPPVLQDLNAQRQVIMERFITKDEYETIYSYDTPQFSNQLEQKIEVSDVNIIITGETPPKETAAEIIARIRAAQKV